MFLQDGPPEKNKKLFGVQNEPAWFVTTWLETKNKMITIFLQLRECKWLPDFILFFGSTLTLLGLP